MNDWQAKRRQAAQWARLNARRPDLREKLYGGYRGDPAPDRPPGSTPEPPPSSRRASTNPTGLLEGQERETAQEDQPWHPHLK
jgi:hypothetical protein